MSRWAPPALIFFAVLAAFAPCLSAGFVNWDDDVYLLTNLSFRGLGWTQLHWMFTTRAFGLYQPLTWLSFGLDDKLWGLEPWGYHLTNVLLHAVAALIFYVVCLRLFEKAAPKAGGETRAIAAAIAALAFAVHPLRVESVAWVVERKDVLSGALLLASVWAYLEERIAVSCSFFALSLAAKASGVFLPAALFALDAYPLRRRGRWAEKIPFVLLAAAASAAAWSARAAFNGAPAPANLAWRVGQIAYGLVFYPVKTLWPSGLAAYYPPRAWFGAWIPETASLAVLGAFASWALWIRRKRSPAAAAAAAWYALALAPVSGIVQYGAAHSVADRFSYLPSLGLSALLGGSILLARGPLRRVLLAGLTMLLIFWGALTWRQESAWNDSVALWKRTTQLEPSALAFDNLSVALGAIGRADEAILDDRRALNLDPSYFRAYANLGSALEAAGRGGEAEEAWRRGLAVAPDSPLLLSLLGEYLCSQAEVKRCRSEGLVDLRRAVALGASGRARDDLAAALARTDDPAGARREYAAALADNGGDAVAHVNLGLLLDAANERDEARRHYRLALRDRAQRAAAQADWGNSLLAQNRPDEALAHYAEAIRLDPSLAQAQVNLGNVLARRGRFAEAAARYRAALKKNPASREARANLSALQPALRS